MTDPNPTDPTDRSGHPTDPAPHVTLTEGVQGAVTPGTGHLDTGAGDEGQQSMPDPGQVEPLHSSAPLPAVYLYQTLTGTLFLQRVTGAGTDRAASDLHKVADNPGPGMFEEHAEDWLQNLVSFEDGDDRVWCAEDGTAVKVASWTVAKAVDLDVPVGDLCPVARRYLDRPPAGIRPDDWSTTRDLTPAELGEQTPVEAVPAAPVQPHHAGADHLPEDTPRTGDLAVPDPAGPSPVQRATAENAPSDPRRGFAGPPISVWVAEEWPEDPGVDFLGMVDRLAQLSRKNDSA